MYHSIKQLFLLAKERKVPAWRIVLETEMEQFEASEAQVMDKLRERYAIMTRSATLALYQPQSTLGGLISGIASKQQAHSQTEGISGRFINSIMARALSCSEVNASMGKICAVPTAGACGILPAVLMGMSEKYDLSEEKILEALLLASGVGAVVMQSATVSGAEGGCQAECGVAAAMSAAAAVYLAGGSDDMCQASISIALMNVLGLVCDPVAGLVQVPCAQRNASQAVNALISADMALAGVDPVVPADEMVEAMMRVGRMLPEALRETAKGGMAASATAQEIAKNLYNSK